MSCLLILLTLFVEATASERFCDSPYFILNLRGEMDPGTAAHAEKNCVEVLTKKYMLEKHLRWRTTPYMLTLPGVEDEIDSFLAKMSLLLQLHLTEFSFQHWAVSCLYSK